MLRPSSASYRRPGHQQASLSPAAAVPAGTGALIVSSVSVRRINASPNADILYVAVVTVGDVTLTTNPERAVPDFVSGWTLSFRVNLVFPLGAASYDTRLGVSVAIQSECGSILFGSASCRQPREWFHLSKPRGEVQVAFSEVFREALPPAVASGGPDAPLRSPAAASALAAPLPRAVSSRMAALGSLRPASASPALGSATTLASAGGALYRQRLVPALAGGGGGASVPPPPPPPLASAAAVALTPRSQQRLATLGLANPRSVEFSALSFSDVVLSQRDSEPAYVAITLAQQTKQTSATVALRRPGETGGGGHGASFASDVLVFDLPLYSGGVCPATISVFRGSNPDDSQCVAHGALSVNVAAGAATTTMRVACVEGGLSRKAVGGSALQQQEFVSRGEIVCTVRVAFHEPRREGAGGRPTSAYSRGGQHQSSPGARPTSAVRFAPTTPPSGTRAAHDTQPGVAIRRTFNSALGIEEDELLEADAFVQNDDNDDDGTSALVDQIGASLDAAISSALQRAFEPVVERLERLEGRVQNNEEQLSRFLATMLAAANRAPATPPTMGSTPPGGPPPAAAPPFSSRPSSGDSRFVSFAEAMPEHAAPCVSAAQLEDRFARYAVDGSITLEQLKHFVMMSNCFAADAPEDEIIEELRAAVRDESHVTFDEFASIALRIAKT